MMDIFPENPHSPTARALVGDLTRELAARYPEEGGDGGFSPDDVAVPRAVFLVACVDGEPAGCGALRPVDAGTAEVKRMYVAERFRGCGVGRAILAELERRAIAFEYRRLILETGVRQPEALTLYAKTGYTRSAPYGPYVENPLSVCFAKDLVCG